MTTIIILAIIGIILYNIIKPIIIMYKLNLGHLIMVTGTNKTGKSTLAIYLTMLKYTSERRKVIIENFFRKIFKKELKELPLLYSNIPLINKHGYVALTKNILLRKKRVVDKSVIYIGEFSLVADSMNMKDMLINEEILLFFKLFGHEFNGTIILDTQNIADCHYAIKRITNKYIFIDKGKKELFSYKVWIRELMYNYENNGINNNINNKGLLEEQEEIIKVPKTIWKVFDYRCYSILTDNLEYENKVIMPNEIKTLKQPNIVSFNIWKSEQMRKGVKQGNETPM